MSQNTGTLVTSTLRPNDSLDPIAVIFSNEAKGGHHSYITYASLLADQASYPNRFDFGMLATVYADPTASNNNTYILQYNYASTASSDPNNWVQYSNIPQINTSEWQNSVISRTSSIPSIINNGDRYLITGIIGGTSTDIKSYNWNGHVDNIATYDNRVNFWNFTFPREGMTVRVDNENDVLYKYIGIYASGGTWIKEYVNQVYSLTASSTDGINFTANANLVGYYKPSVFYTRFLTSSVGHNMYFNINNIGSASVVKIIGNTLQPSLSNGDFNTSIEYQLIWDGSQFQVPFNSSITNIGNPEVGNTYSGGVYNWNTSPSFTPSTSIGTAIDRFNKILAGLVPSPSPVLTNMQPIVGFSGRLTFPISPSLVNNFNPATPSVPSGYGSVGIDGLFSSNGNRIGILAATTSSNRNLTISGIINLNSSGTSSGIPYYQNSFADANHGYLYLVVNGLTISTATLSNLGSIDTTFGLTQPGFILSAATASKFATGAEFEIYYGRTGSYYIPNTSYLGPYSYTSSIGLTANQFGFTRGYNYVKIIQDTTTNIINVPGIDFVIDDNPTNITITSNSISSTIGPSYYTLSGIKYYNYIQTTYTTNINNGYGSIYADGNAITITDYSNSLSTNASPATNLADVYQSFPTLSSNPSNFSSFQITPYVKTWNVSGPNLRRINDSIAFYIKQVNKPAVNNGYFSFNTSSGGGSNITGLVFDNMIGQLSVGYTEYFREESFRLAYIIGYPYDNTNQISNNPYNPTASLATVNTNDLQIYNNALQYPTINFSTIGSSTLTNLNYGISSANYSGLSGNRYYYRWFYFSGYGANYNFTLNFTASNTTIVPLTTALSGNNIHVEVKLPFFGSSSGPYGGITGWLDAATTLNTGTYPNPINGAGCMSSTLPILGGYNIQIGWSGTNIGSGGSNGYLLMRISAPSSWSGNIRQITVTPF
jgi:hypothetical protein